MIFVLREQNLARRGYPLPTSHKPK